MQENNQLKGFVGATRVSLWDGGSKRMMDINIGDKVTGISSLGKLVETEVVSVSKYEKFNQWIDFNIHTGQVLESGAPIFLRMTGATLLFSVDMMDYKKAESFVATLYCKEQVSYLIENETLISHLQPYRDLISTIMVPITEKTSCNFENSVYLIGTATGNFFANSILVAASNFES